MRIRPFGARDLPEVLALQARALPAAGWNASDYVGLSQEAGGLLLVAEEFHFGLPAIIGFAASRIIGGEAELLNIAVDPARRRQGTGRALLKESIRRALDVGVGVSYLEVRSSNEAALALYYSAGFRLHSVRKGYYSQPAEDAHVLSLALDRAAVESATGEARSDPLRRAPAR